MGISMYAPAEWEQEIAEVIRLFDELDEGGEPLRVEVDKTEGGWLARAVIGDQTCESLRPLGVDELDEKRQAKRAGKIAAYRALRLYTGKDMPWGSLTGIRPTKLLYEMRAKGMDTESIRNRFRSEYDVTDEKISLLLDIEESQNGLLDRDWRNDLDIYVGIPFCKGRCVYCSFASVDICRQSKLVDGYVEALQKEIEWTAEAVRGSGHRIRSVYFGGGTPTAIPDKALEVLLARCRSHFSGAEEWTVEAGRPDTITADNLAMLSDMGVTRISVNPQTMNAATLERMGRRHTPGQVQEAFAMARRHNFLINMDLIAGLPGEDEACMEETLKQVCAMQPDNLTVHTLAIKRAAELKMHELNQQLPSAETVSAMVDAGRQAAYGMGMRPYYLYRQKYMTGNLENVGYARPGTQCLYNIDIMEETLPVIALGAGAITKWMINDTLFDRAANVKSVPEYIARVDEMLVRKQTLMQRTR